ncbi:DUF3467 domain-containing protein [Aggregatilinea lenta]|uniref:DUF3467 domain-containing protein n=1 Tax=Aggregatilinea lenta TaxID=913108 RepID=UPI000E5A4B87|nr:DUF3467 domain-containing protein [Aggregatilinea lenta]
MAEPSKPPAEGAKRQLNLEIPADLPATYANFAIISHSPWEIFLDFAQILPNVPKARVRTRLVLTPANAKMLLRALQDNITRYEQQHGEITLPPRAPSLADQLFRTIHTDDPGDTPDDTPEGEPENE